MKFFQKLLFSLVTPVQTKTQEYVSGRHNRIKGKALVLGDRRNEKPLSYQMFLKAIEHFFFATEPNK